MQISESPTQLQFSGRIVTRQAYFVWGIIFPIGMLALLFVQESYRFVGFIVWMAIWLALFVVIPPLLGAKFLVTLDSKTKKITWSKGDQVFRAIPFDKVKEVGMTPTAIGVRPYKTFQLFILLKDGKRFTLAADPKQNEIEHARDLAKKKLGK
jgi:hypothetical protein